MLTLGLFREWWNKEHPCFPIETPYTVASEHAYAEEAWNAALEYAAKVIDGKHDECEPWMDGDDVRAMRTDVSND